ncbi:hypothetical protein N7G274_004283 [Stereocaulon virgatum]|uniref:Uncharacterized protein n=1 Tax=Stereocaulon virgatum TaxID=373712 RepID=A0ABR4AIH3_9LECA
MGRESESHVTFSKVIKGAHEPVEATIYVIAEKDPDKSNCTLTEIKLHGRKKVDGLETNLELQQPAKNAKVPEKAKSAIAKDEDEGEFERTWVAKKGGVEHEGDEDTEEEGFSVHWEKIIFKEIGDGSGYVDEMALIALGKEGENVLTTATWKD